VPVATSLVADAHAVGLTVHPFTFRKDDFPDGDFEDFAGLVRFFTDELQVDGLFTDHPDAVLEILNGADG
jgi:glycerophosphoryl diester phosphodiesterase